MNTNSAFEEAGLAVFERGWLSSNNILFKGDENHESVLIDSGYCGHSDQTLALVENALRGRQLARIINTHLHSDHCGGNRVLQNKYGCKIDVPAGEAFNVDRWDEGALTYLATGQQCPRFRRTGSIPDGVELQLGRWKWTVLGAPGHDPNSFALYQPELRLLISADALWEDGFGVIFPELEGNEGFTSAAETIDKIASLPIDWVIPGHGAPFGDLSEAVSRARSRLKGFVVDPERHARYAAKVLIKFHMLDVQRESLAETKLWLSRTPYMHMTHDRFFSHLLFDTWATELVTGLCLSGALALDGETLRDA